MPTVDPFISDVSNHKPVHHCRGSNVRKAPWNGSIINEACVLQTGAWCGPRPAQSARQRDATWRETRWWWCALSRAELPFGVRQRTNVAAIPAGGSFECSHLMRRTKQRSAASERRDVPQLPMTQCFVLFFWLFGPARRRCLTGCFYSSQLSRQPPTQDTLQPQRCARRIVFVARRINVKEA